VSPRAADWTTTVRPRDGTAHGDIHRRPCPKGGAADAWSHVLSSISGGSGLETPRWRGFAGLSVNPRSGGIGDGLVPLTSEAQAAYHQLSRAPVIHLFVR